MNMDDFRGIDHELILDLASGAISGSDAARIEAALTPEQAEELAAQRAVLAAITRMEAPALTPAERSELHARVDEETRYMTRELDARAIAAQPEHRATRPKRRWGWIPAAGLAGAMVVMAGLVFAGPIGFSGGDDADTSGDSIPSTSTTLTVPNNTILALTDHPDVDDRAVPEFEADAGTPAEVLTRELSRTPPVLDPRNQPCSEEAGELVGTEPDGVHYGYFDGRVSIAFRFTSEAGETQFTYLLVDDCEPIVEDAAGNLHAGEGDGR